MSGPIWPLGICTFGGRRWSQLWAAKHREQSLARLQRPGWDRSAQRISHAEPRSLPGAYDIEW
ncbi:MAG: hypothetical protein NZ602_14645 [Thermoguttaceae bacterium]|nr:hypothetical protein [Thermoguttaceae bacterium]